MYILRGVRGEYWKETTIEMNDLSEEESHVLSRSGRAVTSSGPGRRMRRTPRPRPPPLQLQARPRRPGGGSPPAAGTRASTVWTSTPRSPTLAALGTWKMFIIHSLYPLWPPSPRNPRRPRSGRRRVWRGWRSPGGGRAASWPWTPSPSSSPASTGTTQARTHSTMRCSSVQQLKYFVWKTTSRENNILIFCTRPIFRCLSNLEPSSYSAFCVSPLLENMKLLAVSVRGL